MVLPVRSRAVRKSRSGARRLRAAARGAQKGDLELVTANRGGLVDPRGREVGPTNSRRRGTPATGGVAQCDQAGEDVGAPTTAGERLGRRGQVVPPPERTCARRGGTSRRAARRAARARTPRAAAARTAHRARRGNVDSSTRGRASPPGGRRPARTAAVTSSLTSTPWRRGFGDGRDQRAEAREAGERRQEHPQLAVTTLDAQRGAHRNGDALVRRQRDGRLPGFLVGEATRIRGRLVSSSSGKAAPRPGGATSAAGQPMGLSPDEVQLAAAEAPAPLRQASRRAASGNTKPRGRRCRGQMRAGAAPSGSSRVARARRRRPGPRLVLQHAPRVRVREEAVGHSEERRDRSAKARAHPRRRPRDPATTRCGRGGRRRRGPSAAGSRPGTACRSGASPPPRARGGGAARRPAGWPRAAWSAPGPRRSTPARRGAGAS